MGKSMWQRMSKEVHGETEMSQCQVEDNDNAVQACIKDLYSDLTLF